MTANAKIDSAGTAAKILSGRIGKELVENERWHVHSERCELVDELRELDDVAEADGVTIAARITAAERKAVEVDKLMQAALAELHHARVARSQASQKRDRARNTLVRKLNDTADDALTELRDLLASKTPAPRLSDHEDFDAWQERGEAIRAAVKTLDAMKLEAIEPDLLDERLAEIRASIPNYEATFNSK